MKSSIVLPIISLLSLPLTLAAPVKPEQPQNSDIIFGESLKLGRPRHQARSAPALQYGGLGHPNNFNGNQCGASTFSTTDAFEPSTSDCRNLAAGLYALDGNWALDNGGGAGVSAWVFLAGYGSCKFYANRANLPDPSTASPTYIGTYDLGDLVTSSIALYEQFGIVTGGGTTNIKTDFVTAAHGSM
jgi:hypothetical protein